jgi:hypothetical protein
MRTAPSAHTNCICRISFFFREDENTYLDVYFFKRENCRISKCWYLVANAICPNAWPVEFKAVAVPLDAATVYNLHGRYVRRL